MCSLPFKRQGVSYARKDTHDACGACKRRGLLDGRRLYSGHIRGDEGGRAFRRKLRRRITTRYGENKICIEDRIVNEGFREEPMMLLYHMNFGYPLLCADAEIILPSKKVIPRDETAAPHAGSFGRMEEPKEQEPEYVFLHEMAADEKGKTFAAIINPELGIGVKIAYDVNELPYFMQWKSVASGDYVVGLEPANASVYGRAYHEREQNLHRIRPFAEERKRIEVSFLTGRGLDEVKEEAESLLKERK